MSSSALESPAVEGHERRRITVTKDGPYRVEGGPRLGRLAPVETEFGEPVEWERGEDFEQRQVVELCRCGGSSRKPFCDSTHERIGFDGTETADRRPSAARREVWPGEDVVLTDDLSLCTLHGFCGDRSTKVWQMIDRTADPEVRAKLMGMVDRCPSGRIQYSIPPNPEPFEHDLEPEVAVTPNGPLWVRGGVQVVSEDGTSWERRNRITLCRCGHSENKPLCDGSHNDVGFTDEPAD